MERLRSRETSPLLPSSLSLGVCRLEEGEQEVVVGGDDEQPGAEVEGDDHAPQVPPGGDARHRADGRHHVEHLQERRRYPCQQICPLFSPSLNMTLLGFAATVPCGKNGTPASGNSPEGR